MGAIRDNVEHVRERIAAAARKTGRSPEDICLVAVTKTIPVESMREALDVDIRDFGENYYQEVRDKIPQIESDVRWHFIGHLQTNKAKYIPGRFALVHSVDSRELAIELGKRASAAGIRQPVLVEVKLDASATKFGVSPAAALDFAGETAEFPGIELRGFMAMASFTASEKVVRVQFAQLRECFDRLPAEYRHTLSMGMSGDYEVAIEEGSNMVRIGTGIFGARNTK
jgi:pyridoxal phosphate enzyme (YggS family)